MKEKRMDVNFRKRLQRRLYYGDMANLDVPSFPLTELAVDYFQDSVPEKLGHVDLYSASNAIRRNRVSPCSVVLSMLYAKRLRQQKQQNKDLLQTMSSADVFFISMMMASKYMYDEGVEEEVFNDEWADNTDQDVDDVNRLEIDFLQAMDWKLFVRPHEFEETLAAVERRLALQEGLKRGWYTYTEMDVLMNSDLMWTVWTNVGSECSKLLMAFSAAYLTSVISMMGSTALAVHISGHLSSITVAFLNLQSSPLMLAVSSGLPPPVPALSLSLVLMPPSLRYGDAFEKNESQFGIPGSVISERSESLGWNPDGNWQGRLDDKLDSVQKADSETTSNGNGSGQAEDDSYGKDDSLDAMTKSSLWSLWFFDSLMSQMWAVICIKSKLAHCVKMSISDKLSKFSSQKEPDDFGYEKSGDGVLGRNFPQFRRQMRERRNQNEEAADPTNRKLTFRSSTMADKASMKDKTVVASPEVCNSKEASSQDILCSCHSSSSFNSDHSWHHSTRISGECCCGDSPKCQGLSKDKSESLPDFPSQLNPSNEVTDPVYHYFTHPCCLGHNPHLERNIHTERQPVTSYPQNTEPSEDTPDNRQLLPQVQSGHLGTPIGFVTSIYQALLIT